MKNKDDIDDICDEFGAEPDFVNFVWAMIQQIKKGHKPPSALPLGAFIPRTKRECALAVVAALAYKNEKLAAD